MRVMLFLGAVLSAAMLGAIVNLMMRDRPAATESVAAPAEPVVNQRLGGASFRVPLPAGHCALDANRPEDRETLQQLSALTRGRQAEGILLSAPCDQRHLLSGTSLPPNLRVMVFAGLRMPGVDPSKLQRPAVIARLRERAGGIGGEAFSRSGQGPTATTTRYARDDANAAYLNVRGIQAGLGGGQACGVMAMTLAGRTLVMQMLLENCDTAEVDSAILPQSARLAARMVALNP